MHANNIGTRSEAIQNLQTVVTSTGQVSETVIKENRGNEASYQKLQIPTV